MGSHERARWMRFCGRLVLRALGIRYRVEGTPPEEAALVVANHLSYLDIVIAAAAMPCAFVARHDVAEWPAFGTLARLGGTIFVDRASRRSAWRAANHIAKVLTEGVSVLFFPEGTSTDGSDMLRFNSPLFAPAAEGGFRVVPMAIFYDPRGMALTERDLCWFGDDLFLPHLMRVLGVPGFHAMVRFGEEEAIPDRKAGAYRSYEAVAAMRNGGPR